MEIDFFLLLSRFRAKSLARRLHQLLWLYNGLVLVLFSGFYYVTQHKIIEAMSAHSFLQNLPVLPLPADEVLALSWLSFGVLFFCGRIYHRQDLTLGTRYLALLAETIACIVAMRSLSLAYDGLVLLVVADLMHRYDGKNTGGLLLGAMLVLFFAAGVVKSAGSLVELKRPEHALKVFVRFAIAKGVVTYGMELMLALLEIAQVLEVDIKELLNSSQDEVTYIRVR